MCDDKVRTAPLVQQLLIALAALPLQFTTSTFARMSLKDSADALRDVAGWNAIVFLGRKFEVCHSNTIFRHMAPVFRNHHSPASTDVPLPHQEIIAQYLISNARRVRAAHHKAQSSANTGEHLGCFKPAIRPIHSSFKTRTPEVMKVTPCRRQAYEQRLDDLEHHGTDIANLLSFRRWAHPNVPCAVDLSDARA